MALYSVSSLSKHATRSVRTDRVYYIPRAWSVINVLPIFFLCVPFDIGYDGTVSARRS